VKLFSKNSNLCDHNPPTSQTDRRTDRQTTCDGNTALCTKVHRAVKIEFGIGGCAIFRCFEGLTCTFQSLLSRSSSTFSIPPPPPNSHYFYANLDEFRDPYFQKVGRSSYWDLFTMDACLSVLSPLGGTAPSLKREESDVVFPIQTLNIIASR